jgi:phosphotriesterase-related protein
MTDLVKAGADPSRIVMGHLDTMGTDAVRRVAEAGAFVQYDTFGLEDTLWGEVAGQATAIPSDVQRMERIEQLIEWGYEDRILIAHDVCFKSMLSRFGGKGYFHILESIVPRMRRRGLSERSMRSILVDNPGRVLTFP